VALAAVSDLDGRRPARPARPVAGPALSLADRLTAARLAAEEPRRHLAEIQGALKAAENSKDYGEAQRLAADLPAAREAALVADATVRALADAEASLSAQAAAEQRAATLAGQQAQAQQILGDAITAEQAAFGEIDEHLSQFRAFLSAAQQAFRAAEGSELAVLAARQRMAEARMLAGEERQPPPVRPNRTEALLDEDPVLRAVVGWPG